MKTQTDAISFIYIPSDKVVIPHFDVSKAKMNDINDQFLSLWQQFINEKQQLFNQYDRNISKFINILGLQYNIIINNDYLVMLPPHFTGGLINNFPDLYHATHNQLTEFINKTQMKLNEILIRTSEKQILVNMKLHPTTFLNLSFSDTRWLIDQAKKQSSKIIWLSIVIWWRYRDNNAVTDDSLISLLETHCIPDLYYCNYYVMFYARVLELDNKNLIKWCENHLINVIWDEDLLSDTPSYHLEKCKNVITHDLFMKELVRCGIAICL